MSRVFIALIIALLILAFILLAADSLNLANAGRITYDVPNFSDSCSNVQNAVGVIEDDEI
jgi:hypothetical protein